MSRRTFQERDRFSGQADSSTGWQPLRPETLVDKVIQTVIEGAARGIILPGDRIVEVEVAQKLGISRVPIREALRILESQGLVVNEPYKGIRLTPVTRKRIDDLIEARISLETSAIERAISSGRNGAKDAQLLLTIVNEMELMSVRGDSYGIGNADTNFHRVLVSLSGNDVLSQLWEMLSRQLTIIFGLSTLAKPMPEIVGEHRRLVDEFKSGNMSAIAKEIDEHIRAQNQAIDFVALIEKRKAERDAAQK